MEDGRPDAPPAQSPGTLFVVATPIGNLEDLTYRAARILREVDYVACEDTRVSAKLLTHLGLKKPLLSYFHPQERRKKDAILRLLVSGRSVALITDSGTPGVSDPGAILVEEAHRLGIRVEPVPGPCAAAAAFSAAGLGSGGFWMAAFLPEARGERHRLLHDLARAPVPVVIYVAPHDLRNQLDEISRFFGDRDVLLAREMTKKFEEVRRTTVSALSATLTDSPRGELVLVIGPGSVPEAAGEEPIESRYKKLIDEGRSRPQAIKELSQELSIPKRRVVELLGQAAG